MGVLEDVSTVGQLLLEYQKGPMTSLVAAVLVIQETMTMSLHLIVGNDFFCESGLHSAWNYKSVLFPDDVLWDGQDCTANSTCCQLNNPPWFTKSLPTATTDGIELRICINVYGDVPLELIELYVQ